MRNPEGRTLFEEIVHRGIPYSSHESDLYIPCTEETRALLKEPWYLMHKLNATSFPNNCDERRRWYDISFAYQPWWEAREPKKANEEGR